MKRLFSALFPCILLLSVLLTAFRSGDSSAALSETQLKNRIEQLSVVLRGSGAEGSGCIYEYDAEKGILVIITAGHVAADLAENAEAVFADGTVLPVSFFKAAEEIDLGYGYLERDSLTEAEKADFDREAAGLKEEKPLQIRMGSSLQKNDVFYMPQQGNGKQISLAAGYVVDPARYLKEFGCEMIYADGTASAGMSGSGMFDETGRLIGILCGATEHCELAGVPAEKIQEYMQK